MYADDAPPTSDATPTGGGSQYDVRSHLRGQLAADERRQLAELLLQGGLIAVVGDDPIKRHAGVQTAL